VVAGLSIILSAVYTLNMIRRVFFGSTNTLTDKATDIRMNEKIVLAVIVMLIVFVGVYPQPVLNLTKETAEFILTRMNFKL
jgi:NADH-quinone oxidoreductase subunit M